jgi:hypothetical protein
MKILGNKKNLARQKTPDRIISARQRSPLSPIFNIVREMKADKALKSGEYLP